VTLFTGDQCNSPESGKPVKREAVPVPAAAGNPDVRGRSKPLAIDGIADATARDPAHAGLLIINADDWGRDHATTEQTFECIRRGAVSSVSAMVFMGDSERAAAIAKENVIHAGLHLNFTTPFSAPDCSTQLAEHQQRVARYLLQHRLAQVLFCPVLTRSFEYVVSAQLDEFCRLYGAPPQRLDGHHHMHLCANVLLGRLLPPGTVIRRNFSFQPGEKSFGNRFYRKVADRLIARRHRLTDFFFALLPLQPPGRLERIFSLARRSVVEVETHALDAEEYRFLTEGEIFRRVGDVPIASPYAVMPNGRSQR
jgi:chitin disaccharide deacetylase